MSHTNYPKNCMQRNYYAKTMVQCLSPETCKDQVEFVVLQCNVSNKKGIPQHHFFPIVCVQCVTTHTSLKPYL